MTTLKAIVGNLAVVKYLVVHGRKYKQCDLETLLDTIDELLIVPDTISTEELEAFGYYMTECINNFEYLNEHKDSSLEHKQKIEVVLQRLHKIRDRCRQLQDLEQLVLRIRLTVQLYR